MHFGRVSSPDGIRFDPVREDPRTRRVLGDAPASQTALRLGAPVWSVRGWVGEVYPPRTHAREFLRHYARRFPTVEVNSTFYSIPPRARFEAWRDTVPEGFRFCPKIPRDASHVRPGVARNQALAAFSDAIEGLGDRLGTPFLQLPPEVGPDRFDEVRDLVSRLPPSHRPAVEFRHPDWFVSNRLRGRAFEWMHEEGIPSVISDVAGRRDVLHGSLPTTRVVVRFGGNRLHESDFARVRDWARTLARWFRMGLREAYVFIHQPEDEYSPRLISAMEEEIDAEAPGLLPPRPEPLSLPPEEPAQLRLL